MNELPIYFHWTGDAMVPIHPKRADREYVVGETYCLAPYADRSAASHAHQFAWIHDAWLTLPEHLALEFPSAEHLRKRALIEAGYYDEQTIEVGSLAAAVRVARAIQTREEFSLVFARKTFVIIRTPKSQSRRAMGAKVFQESKEKILEIIAQMIGVSPAQLLSEAGKAA